VADRGSQADLDRPLDVETLEGAAHQRPAQVVAELLLVGLGSQAVEAEVKVVELAERSPADEADDDVLLDRPPSSSPNAASTPGASFTVAVSMASSKGNPYARMECIKKQTVNTGREEDRSLVVVVD